MKKLKECLNSHRVLSVLIAALISILILCYIAFSNETVIEALKTKIGDSRGLWTLITALITAPIAFIIWFFRDINATQQIENQRKDINLKEFQKIAEWVSGLHLIEDEITEKNTQDHHEITRKYTQQSDNSSIPTFSKKDGTVGLQIAAIYNLLPFYRGEHGESFKKPAFNLLLSAWLALQQKNIQIPSNLGTKKQGYMNNSLAVAITQVMLCDGGRCFFEHNELFPNICLAGMNFHLQGINIDLLKENFKKNSKNNKLNFRGANLQGAILREFDLNTADFSFADISGVDLSQTILSKASFSSTRCDNTSFVRAKLGGYLHRYDLDVETLSTANLYGGHFFRNIFSKKEAETLKSRGAILCEEGSDIVRAKHRTKKDIIEIESPVDLIKTQEENSAWKIIAK
ncbi:pentapeptide repeat-containing protein [Bisgaard Taxon 46]